MKVNLNLDKIEHTLEYLVASKLQEKKLPDCMGAMVLPILNQVESFEDTDILSITDKTPKETLVDIDLKEISVKSDSAIEGKSLSIVGLKRILEFKNKKVESFVEQCSRCISCEYSSICNALTQNTLRSLHLLVLNNKDNSIE
jgi:hypothetical protein